MKKELKIPADAETKIAKSSTLTGNLEVLGDLLVNGRAEGNITCHGDVYIGKTSVVNGDISAKNAYIWGIVQGGLRADGAVVLASSAKLFGNVSAQSFSAEKGCVYKGICETSGSGGADLSESKDNDTEFGEPKLDSASANA